MTRSQHRNITPGKGDISTFLDCPYMKVGICGCRYCGAMLRYSCWCIADIRYGTQEIGKPGCKLGYAR
jgi:hypothetical protein